MSAPPQAGPRSLRRLVFATVSCAGVAAAHAHPGHGLQDYGLQHALTSPDHASLLLASGALLWSLGAWIKSLRHARLLRWAGLTTMLVAGFLFAS